MTKLESAEIIIKQGGKCIFISCLDCCCASGFKCNAPLEVDALALAIKYKKENAINPICDKFCTFDE